MQMGTIYIQHQVRSAAANINAAASRMPACTTLRAVVLAYQVQVPAHIRPLVRRETGLLHSASVKQVTRLLEADLEKIKAAPTLAEARAIRAVADWDALRGHFPTELQRATAKLQPILASFGPASPPSSLHDN